jgi:hypothetical protein
MYNMKINIIWHSKCLFHTHECVKGDLNTHQCEFDTYECEFDPDECDQYK